MGDGPPQADADMGSPSRTCYSHNTQHADDDQLGQYMRGGEIGNWGEDKVRYVWPANIGHGKLERVKLQWLCLCWGWLPYRG